MEANSLPVIHQVIVKPKYMFSLLFTLCPATSVTLVVVSRLKEEELFSFHSFFAEAAGGDLVLCQQ